MTDALEPVLVVIPTYNERENLEPIVKRLHAALPAAQVLVVDDGSPDGTGEIADKLSAADERIHVLHRTEKAGLGAAGERALEAREVGGAETLLPLSMEDVDERQLLRQPVSQPAGAVRGGVVDDEHAVAVA